MKNNIQSFVQFNENLNISNSDTDLYNFLNDLPKGLIEMSCIKEIELRNLHTHEKFNLSIGDKITINSYAGTSSKNFYVMYKSEIVNSYISDLNLYNHFKLLGELNENLKGALNFERSKRAMANKEADKIKWFDKLPYRERQDHFNKLRGRKRDLVFIRDVEKACIYNLEHNGGYYKD